MSLLLEIDRFLRRTGMSRTTFGRQAIRDPRLIGDMLRGRELRQETRDRVRAFMRDQAGR